MASISDFHSHLVDAFFPMIKSKNPILFPVVYANFLPFLINNLIAFSSTLTDCFKAPSIPNKCKFPSISPTIIFVFEFVAIFVSNEVAKAVKANLPTVFKVEYSCLSITKIYF